MKYIHRKELIIRYKFSLRLAISSKVQELIKLGASKVVVFGDFAIGCSPIYLTNFKSNDSNAYDDKGCLKAYNAFSQFRNTYVQVALAKLRQEFPRATILYGDYYNGYKYVLDRASYLGKDIHVHRLCFIMYCHRLYRFGYAVNLPC